MWVVKFGDTYLKDWSISQRWTRWTSLICEAFVSSQDTAIWLAEMTGGEVVEQSELDLT